MVGLISPVTALQTAEWADLYSGVVWPCCFDGTDTRWALLIACVCSVELASRMRHQRWQSAVGVRSSVPPFRVDLAKKNMPISHLTKKLYEIAVVKIYLVATPALSAVAPAHESTCRVWKLRQWCYERNLAGGYSRELDAKNIKNSPYGDKTHFINCIVYTVNYFLSAPVTPSLSNSVRVEETGERPRQNCESAVGSVG